MTRETWLVLLAVIIAGAIGAGYYFYKKKESGSSARDLPESRKSAEVVRTLNGFARMHEYKVIAPAKLAKDGKCADLDAILVGWFGLLCVKCVGLGGEIYGSKEDAEWLQVMGERRISFANPLRAAETDTRLVRDILFTDKLRSISVETVCVFTNRKATLALPRSTGHYTVKDLKALLRRDKYEQDKKVDLEAVTKAIEKWRVESL